MLAANLLAFLVLFSKTLMALSAPEENHNQQYPRDHLNFKPESHKNWHLLPPKDECGKTTATFRIVGGKEVALGSYPWIVRIGYGNSDDPQFVCGASLISDYYVLTAAHCVEDPDFKITRARFGEHDTKSDPDCQEIDGQPVVCAPPVQDIRVVKVIRHENYDTYTTKNDVALLKLERPPQFNGYVQPACLPFGVGMRMNFEGEDTTVAGWGLTNGNDDFSESSVLMAVTQKVYDAKACRQIYQGDVNYNQGQICVGGSVGKDSCSGDSGGPLMYTGSFDPTIGERTYVIGLVSFGPADCGDREIPGVYTRTNFFMRWILDNMEE